MRQSQSFVHIYIVIHCIHMDKASCTYSIKNVCLEEGREGETDGASKTLRSGRQGWPANWPSTMSNSKIKFGSLSYHYTKSMSHILWRILYRLRNTIIISHAINIPDKSSGEGGLQASLPWLVFRSLMTSLVRSLMTLLVSSSMTFSDGSKEPDDESVSTVNPSPDGLFMKTRQKKHNRFWLVLSFK